MRKTAQGFTLVELLVVIAIIGILALVVMLVINPIELTKRTRDAARLSDLSNLQNAINVAVQESTNSGNAILCKGASYPCFGNSVPGTNANRKNDGTGWVKVDLSAKGAVSVPTLPVDPVNTAGAGAFHYLYCADKPAGQVDGWEVVTNMESTQYTDKETTDGGIDPNLYETGSNLALLNSSANCTY